MSLASLKKYTLHFWFCLTVLIPSVVGIEELPLEWHSASRLATVESLVDRNTLAIDGSALLLATGDKILINNRYYSSQPPVQAILMAPFYWLLKVVFRIRAADDPDRYRYWMSVFWSSSIHLMACFSLFILARTVLGSRLPSLLFATSFAFCTMSTAYSSAINNHSLLLLVAIWVFLFIEKMKPENKAAPSTKLYLFMGLINGVAYTLDLLAGPLLFISTFIWIFSFQWPLKRLLLYCLGALPLLLIHHLLTFSISGTFCPTNMFPKYFIWPGTPWNEYELTGTWKHTSVPRWFSYAGSMLVGRRGFLTHNLPEYLFIFGALLLLWKGAFARRNVLLCFGWSLSVWLGYSLLSNNHSGHCISIRWFLPLLGPAYYVLALLVKEKKEYLVDFLLLSLAGAVAGAVMIEVGPWWHRPTKISQIEHITLLLWMLLRICDWMKPGVLVTWASFLVYDKRVKISQRQCQE